MRETSHPPPPMDLQYILSPPLVSSQHHVHPNPDDAIISFDSSTRSFPKPTKSSAPTAADPYAEHFLRDMLGPEKWSTFSTRLFERRLGGKNKGKNKQSDDDKSGASAVEFLVKVELVKSILRECVPHPYNPRKSLSHPYPPAPSGHVTLTRSTVLLLCGWSNTQFSYWARRAEALSVLAQHDPRLRAVALALEHRLSSSSSSSPDPAVTGKGLDLIIDDVKKRTGKSQFLRGKHSSLDPFGTAPPDPAAPPPPTQYAMPTFQAERYDHAGPIRPSASASASASASVSVSASASSSTSPPRPSPSHPSPRATRASARRAAATAAAATTAAATTTTTTTTTTAADDTTAPHHFPLSHSRSEATGSGPPVTITISRKRRASTPDAPSPKRIRTYTHDPDGDPSPTPTPTPTPSPTPSPSP